MNLLQPHKSSNDVVVIDGVIHWVAYDPEFERQNWIITFDLTSEEFGKVDHPDSLVGFTHLDISNLKESLVVLHYYIGDAGGWVCDIWMMLKNGVLKCSFKKLSSVSVMHYSITGFRKNGQPILGGDGELEVFEPGSKRMNGLGVYGYVFKMASYTKSLLLNHPDSIVHHDDN
ncbi:putative F-box associated interaction domain-containing protein [Helianthus annuus]|nr:putative F-box associated interaction domain-containing protein [Helianthus annuus]